MIKKKDGKRLDISDVIELWEGFCEEFLEGKELPDEFKKIENIIGDTLDWINEVDDSVADEIDNLASDIQSLASNLSSKFEITER